MASCAAALNLLRLEFARGARQRGGVMPTKLLLTFAAGLLLAGAGIAGAAGSQPGTAFDFTFDAIDGGKLALASFRGKVLLVVNTASFCGFTPQYKGLQELSDRYEDKGLVVIGVPSNDFGAQEPGSASEIAEFCQGAFGITFPLASKVDVKGSDAHPFYQWAARMLGPSAAPQWNFHKYLVGRDGRLVAGYKSEIEPTSSTLTEAVERELAARP
jgi:glutathione peroxidase